MKNFAVSFEKFNKKVKPFVIKRYGKKVSVVYYKDATDYIFKLHKRIADKLDFIDIDEDI